MAPPKTKHAPRIRRTYMRIQHTAENRGAGSRSTYATNGCHPAILITAAEPSQEVASRSSPRPPTRIRPTKPCRASREPKGFPIQEALSMGQGARSQLVSS
ncbi:hypothetical protein Nepgr_013033 [Nepenthes gracilis]|uniref:Uncharacterized protein n=1 Tax=Nepenthes gracilis TaxID=150966 RepID=A0AAD3SIC1_NEPGR|nr:hypothetical protein Nepgr_013033 [Nepenthes gracilis]